MAITGIRSRTAPLGRGDGRGRAGESTALSKGKSAGLGHLLKEAWPFIRPQRVLLLFGLALMAINRLAGLVLPPSAKFLVDNVIGNRQIPLPSPPPLAPVAPTPLPALTPSTPHHP